MKGVAWVAPRSAEAVNDFCISHMIDRIILSLYEERIYRVTRCSFGVTYAVRFVPREAFLHTMYSVKYNVIAPTKRSTRDVYLAKYIVSIQRIFSIHDGFESTNSLYREALGF